MDQVKPLPMTHTIRVKQRVDPATHGPGRSRTTSNLNDAIEEDNVEVSLYYLIPLPISQCLDLSQM